MQDPVLYLQVLKSQYLCDGTGVKDWIKMKIFLVTYLHLFFFL